MPTRITYDCQTGKQAEVEMEGDELAAYLAQLAVPDHPFPPNPLAAIVADLEAVAGRGSPAEIARTLAASLRKLRGTL